MTLTNAFAQDSVARIEISGTDINSLPQVTVYVNALDGQGQKFDISQQAISVKHNGIHVDDARVIGTKQVGTFTVFLLDITAGTVSGLPDVQAMIESYASSPTMEERIDYVAVYRVDETSAIEMLSATEYHNPVRNMFATGVQASEGSTALLNSLGDLLNRMDSIAPRPGMSSSIVVFTDGTDNVSENFSAENIPTLSKQTGVTIHTVWLDNTLFSSVGRNNGQTYLTGLAEATGGTYSTIDNPGLTKSIWERIADNRDHIAVGYTIPPEEFLPGSFELELGLPDTPTIPLALATSSIPDSIPSVTIDVDPEAALVTVPAVDEPIELSFPASVKWLDGQTRAIASAELFLNGNKIADIPPEALNNYAAEMPVQFGVNSVQIAVKDETGAQAVSVPFALTVEQGDEAIPSILGGTSRWLRLLMIAAGTLLVLALAYFILRYIIQRIRTTGGIRRRPKNVKKEPAPVSQGIAKPAARQVVQRDLSAESTPPQKATTSQRTRVGKGVMTASIEVLDSLSNVDTFNDIVRSEYLIGRSPTVDLSFTDDPTVSRIHATIVQDGDIYRIYDEQSTSGSYVNDRQVPEYGLQLADGDEIHLGAVHMRFRQRRSR